MVDYTKPEMRDATWRIWKGGQKLADELRSFYTKKNVFDRIAAQNPMGPATPKTSGSRWQCKGCEARAEVLRKMRHGVFRHTGNIRRSMRASQQRLIAQAVARAAEKEGNSNG